MKKFQAICLAAGLSLTMPFGVLAEDLNPAPETSQTEIQVPEIKTADDFIKAFCGLTVQNIDSSQKVKESFELFRMADQTNKDLILAGRQVYETLAPSLQQAIVKKLAKENIVYDTLVDQARKVDADLKAKADQEAKDKAASKDKEAKDAKALLEQLQKAQAAEASEKDKPSAASDQAQTPLTPAVPVITDQAKTETPVSDPAIPAIPSDSADQNKAEPKTDQTDDSQSTPSKETPAKADDMPGTDQTPTDPAKTDEAENPDSPDEEGDDSQPEVNLEILRQTSMEGSASLDNAKIPVILYGQKIEALPDGISLADLKKQLDMPDGQLYDSVFLYASLNDLSACSGVYYALKSGDRIVLFTISPESDEKAIVNTYNSDAFSFDFVSGSVSFVPKETLSIKKEEVKKPVQVPAKAPSKVQAAVRPEILETAAPAAKEEPVIKEEQIETPIKDQAASMIESSAADQMQSVNEIESKAAEQILTPVVPDTPAAQKLPTNVSEVISSLASGFINDYCANSAGQIYTRVDGTNYRQILNGFRAWLSMSAADQNAVNNSLAAAGSATYQTLYRQANLVRLGMAAGTGNIPVNSSTRPNTAASQSTLFYSLMTAFSAAGFLGTLFSSKRKEND